MINAKNQNERTPVMLALMNRSNAVFDMLVQVEGVDLLFQDVIQRTMLHFAVLLRRPDIMRMLIEKGVDVDAKEMRGLTALQYAELTEYQEGIDILTK